MGRLLLILFLCATAAFARPAPRERRALLLVSDLSGPAREDLRWFYRLAESYFVTNAAIYGNHAYSGVWLLSGDDATLEGFGKSVESLSESMDAVDVMLELHGLPGELVFADGAHSSSEAAAHVKGLPHLRALYSAACYGSTHIGDWLASGFRAASGARGVNTNGLWDFPAFLASWTHGRSFLASQSLGNLSVWRKLFDRTARRLGLGDDADSFKDVGGEGGLALRLRPARIDPRALHLPARLERLDRHALARFRPRLADLRKAASRLSGAWRSRAPASALP